MSHPDKNRKHAVLVFPKRAAAQSAYIALHNAGVDRTRMTLFTQAKANEKYKEGKIDDAIDITGAAGAGLGASAGGVGGLLAGLGLLVIPGVGPLLAGGPIAVALAGAITGGALGGFAGSLTGLGVSEIEAKIAERHVRAGRSVILLEGDVGDTPLAAIARAEGALDLD